MALDNNAGTKRTVSLMRNLTPNVPAEAVVVPEIVAAAVEAKPTLDSPSYERKVEARTPKAAATRAISPEAVPQSNRTKKVSFLASRELEERFRKARLRAGFDKLEDAYNEALENFCAQVEAGKIDRF